MRKILLILLALATVLSALALSACGSGEAGGNTETAAPETAAEGTKTYTVTWKQYNGDYIKMQPDVPAGTTPVFGQADPTRPDDADNSYVFAGWDPTPGPISGDVTYTATYTATPLAKHEVTSDEFAAALSLDGKSFTMSGRIQAIEASMRFLADYTMVLEGVEEGEKVWFGYVKEDNGTFTYVRATDTDPNGSPIWKIDDSGISPAEMKLEREKFLGIIGQIRAATTYDNYTYDPKTETYKAIVDGSAIELSFSGGKLERVSINVEGVLTYNFSDYGTTVVTDDEIAAMRNAGLILEAKKSNDYMDHDWISIGAAKGSAASRKIYAKFEVPDNFDPSAQMLIIGIQCDNYPEDPEEDEVYFSSEYFSASVSLGGKKLELSYDADAKGFFTYLTTDEGGKTVSLGAGTYTFTLEATVLQDLPSTGSNEIRVAIGIVEL